MGSESWLRSRSPDLSSPCSTCSGEKSAGEGVQDPFASANPYLACASSVSLTGSWKRLAAQVFGAIHTATLAINGDTWWHSAALSEFEAPFLNGAQRSVNRKVQGSNPCSGASFANAGCALVSQLGPLVSDASSPCGPAAGPIRAIVRRTDSCRLRR